MRNQNNKKKIIQMRFRPDPKQITVKHPKSRLKKFKPTGEKKIFLEIWAQREHVSEISGKTLLPPEHPQFHWQFLHILSKGTYPSYRLRKENIVMGTVDEHRLQTIKPNYTKSLPEWKSFWEKYEQLKQEYYGTDNE